MTSHKTNFYCSMTDIGDNEMDDIMIFAMVFIIGAFGLAGLAMILQTKKSG